MPSPRPRPCREQALSPTRPATREATVRERVQTRSQGDEPRDEDQARSAALEPPLGRATSPIGTLKNASGLREPASTGNGR